MSNGENAFGVKYSRITFLSYVLRSHPNIVRFERDHDILFRLDRRNGDKLNLVCIDDYVCGLTRVLEVLKSFPDVNFIFIGGRWNSYTSEAKEYCKEHGIGLANIKHLNQDLAKKRFWDD